ncbi:hypothetical protein EIL26_22290 [Salmonella enterica subsp. enterica serovar Newport]|nr:hypothetical protein [Salmonella enterica subsp. enterica serovar Newport]
MRRYSIKPTNNHQQQLSRSTLRLGYCVGKAHQQAEIQREGNLYVVICCIVQHTNTTKPIKQTATGIVISQHPPARTSTDGNYRDFLYSWAIVHQQTQGDAVITGTVTGGV